MERNIYLVLLLFFVSGISLNAQTIKGKITSNGEVVPFANVVLEGNRSGVSADENGNYVIKNAELGHHHIIVSAIGMLTKKYIWMCRKELIRLILVLMQLLMILIRL